MWCVNGCVVMKNVCCVHYLYEYLCCDTCAQRTRKDTVAEWLRRPTRNRLGLSRVGSSPASVVDFWYFNTCQKRIPKPVYNNTHTSCQNHASLISTSTNRILGNADIPVPVPSPSDISMCLGYTHGSLDPNR